MISAMTRPRKTGWCNDVTTDCPPDGSLPGRGRLTRRDRAGCTAQSLAVPERSHALRRRYPPFPDRAKERRIAYLAAFQHDLQTITPWLSGPCPAQRRARCEPCRDAQRIDAERAHHFARTVAPGYDHARKIDEIEQPLHHLRQCATDLARGIM